MFKQYIQDLLSWCFVKDAGIALDYPIGGLFAYRNMLKRIF